MHRYIKILFFAFLLYGCMNVNITANYKMSSDYNKKVNGPRPEIVDNKTENNKLVDTSTKTIFKNEKKVSDSY